MRLWHVLAFVIGILLVLFGTKPRGGLSDIENKADSISSLYQAHVDSLHERLKGKDSVIDALSKQVEKHRRSSGKTVIAADSLRDITEALPEDSYKERYEARTSENLLLRAALADLESAVEAQDSIIRSLRVDRETLLLTIDNSLSKVKVLEGLVTSATEAARKQERHLKMKGALVGALIVTASLVIR